MQACRIRLAASLAAVASALSRPSPAQDGVWTAGAPMPSSRQALAAASVDGVVYAAGGKTGNTCSGLQILEAFDPWTDSWATEAPMPTGRFNPAAAVLDGLIYIVGGDIGCGARSGANEAYDPASNTWGIHASMPTPRTSLGLGAVDGILYAVGGVDSDNLVATNEAYDPVSDRWTTMAPMPVPLASMVVRGVNGKLYVIGGQGNGGWVNSVEVYDPGTNSWSTNLAPMPTMRANFAGDALDGRIYIVGGSDPGNGQNLVDAIEAYDPGADAWRTGIAALPTPRAYLAAGVANGVLYAIGGGPDAQVIADNDDFTPAASFTSLCDSGSEGVLACPCSNAPSGPGRGCNNSAGTGGAVLSASGFAILSSDSLVFTTTGEKPTATSILLQGTAVTPTGLVYGQGVRCVDGLLKRLYTKTASGGSITGPNFGLGDPSVSVRSAAKGDVILAGQSRWYLVCYRDPVVLGGCPASRTYNATQTGLVTWAP
jgi:hypothetical protein